MLHRFLLIASSVLVVASAAAAMPRGPELDAYPDPARWEPAIQAFEAETRSAPPPPGAVVFYGSSSIAGWHDSLAVDMAPLAVVPRGFGGSTMWDALHYVDRAVVPLRPSAVVLYEGDNDVGAHRVAPEVVADLFAALVERIRGALPGTEVYFLSIKPSPSRWESWPAMRDANERIRTVCEGDSLLHFVDVAAVMLDGSGRPREDIFLDDDLHLNRRGYELWRDVVRAALGADQRPGMNPRTR